MERQPILCSELNILKMMQLGHIWTAGHRSMANYPYDKLAKVRILNANLVPVGCNLSAVIEPVLFRYIFLFYE
jgi:hypothetical protein